MFTLCIYEGRRLRCRETMSREHLMRWAKEIDRLLDEIMAWHPAVTVTVTGPANVVFLRAYRAEDFAS